MSFSPLKHVSHPVSHVDVRLVGRRNEELKIISDFDDDLSRSLTPLSECSLYVEK